MVFAVYLNHPFLTFLFNNVFVCISSVFRGLLSIAEPPNKVLEVRFDNYLSRPIHYREDSMLLYGPSESKNSKDKCFEIVLNKPFTESLHHMYRYLH